MPPGDHEGKLSTWWGSLGPVLACAVQRKKVTVGILPGRYPNRKAGHSGVGVPGSSHGDGVQSPGRAPWAIMAEGG